MRRAQRETLGVRGILLLWLASVLLSSCAMREEGGPSSLAKLRPGEKRSLDALLAKLPDQTGHTEGFGEEFNIDQFEPARSLIAMGEKAVPALMDLLGDERPTRARWNGRGCTHRLSVGDVAACVLRKIRSPSAYEKLVVHMRRFKEDAERRGQLSGSWTIFCWAALDIAKELLRTPQGCFTTFVIATRERQGLIAVSAVNQHYWDLIWSVHKDLGMPSRPDLIRKLSEMVAKALSSSQVTFEKSQGERCRARLKGQGLSGVLLFVKEDGVYVNTTRLNGLWQLDSIEGTIFDRVRSELKSEGAGPPP